MGPDFRARLNSILQIKEFSRLPASASCPQKQFDWQYASVSPIFPIKNREQLANDGDRHSALMLAVRMTLLHLSVSSAMSFSKSAGAPASGMPPNSASRAFILGSASAALISLLSVSTISRGVFARAPTPCQPLAS